jgi:predicted metalloendopeptidase
MESDPPSPATVLQAFKVKARDRMWLPPEERVRVW